MFFKSSTTPAPAARSAQSTTRSAPSKSGIPSLLSGDVRIRGDVISAGEIQVDGVVEGDIVAECLVISEAGTVRGAISAKSIRVLGTVAGAITADSVKLARTARVTGDIVHRALSIEEGAAFLGHCRSEEAEIEADETGEPIGAALGDDRQAESSAEPSPAAYKPRQPGDAVAEDDDDDVTALSAAVR